MVDMTNTTRILHQCLQIQTIPGDDGTAADAMNVAQLVAADALDKGAGIFVLLLISAEEIPLSISYPHPYLEEAKVELFRSPVVKEASIGGGELLIDAVVAMPPPCSSYVQSLKFLLMMQK